MALDAAMAGWLPGLAVAGCLPALAVAQLRLRAASLSTASRCCCFRALLGLPTCTCPLRTSVMLLLLPLPLPLDLPLSPKAGW